MSLVALMKLSVNRKYQLPQERKLSHYIQSISDGNVEAKGFLRSASGAPGPSSPLSRVLIIRTLFLTANLVKFKNNFYVHQCS